MSDRDLFRQLREQEEESFRAAEEKRAGSLSALPDITAEEAQDPSAARTRTEEAGRETGRPLLIAAGLAVCALIAFLILGPMKGLLFAERQTQSAADSKEETAATTGLTAEAWTPEKRTVPDETAESGTERVTMPYAEPDKLLYNSTDWRVWTTSAGPPSGFGFEAAEPDYLPEYDLFLRSALILRGRLTGRQLLRIEDGDPRSDGNLSVKYALLLTVEPLSVIKGTLMQENSIRIFVPDYIAAENYSEYALQYAVVGREGILMLSNIVNAPPYMAAMADYTVGDKQRFAIWMNPEYGLMMFPSAYPSFRYDMSLEEAEARVGECLTLPELPPHFSLSLLMRYNDTCLSYESESGLFSRAGDAVMEEKYGAENLNTALSEDVLLLRHLYRLALRLKADGGGLSSSGGDPLLSIRWQSEEGGGEAGFTTEMYLSSDMTFLRYDSVCKEIERRFSLNREVQKWYAELALRKEQEVREREDWFSLSWGDSYGGTMFMHSYDSRSGQLIKLLGFIEQEAYTTSFYFSDEQWELIRHFSAVMNWDAIPEQYDPQPIRAEDTTDPEASRGSLFLQFTFSAGGREKTVICRNLPKWADYPMQKEMDGSEHAVFSYNMDGNRFLSLMRLITAYLEESEAWKSLPDGITYYYYTK